MPLWVDLGMSFIRYTICIYNLYFSFKKKKLYLCVCGCVCQFACICLCFYFHYHSFKCLNTLLIMFFYAWIEACFWGCKICPGLYRHLSECCKPLMGISGALAALCPGCEWMTRTSNLALITSDLPGRRKNPHKHCPASLCCVWIHNDCF